MKIVVVEDDKIAQIGIKKIFGAVDIDIDLVMASNGQEGLDYFDKSEAEGTDLVLLDLNMPVVNGFEFLAGIRQSSKFKDLPVIVHTTSDNEEDLKKCRALGIGGYFVKNVDYSVYKETLECIANYWHKSKQKGAL
jgi:CheY-like chemotaxis protein